ncbi:LPXTG cell wall anchor domain-containing protein [Plantactinospora sp. GCM10030261]|uniref:DUF7507 domain-containing protein n=1 Tax=Plantactinospora sp. GCM10030261 TaxID=3273420 RepID=UPI003621C663
MVVNTGGLTLSNVNVTDVQTPPSSNADLGPISCPSTSLAPGASTICTATYTVTQADLDNGAVTDTATAHGTPPGSQTPIDSPPASLTIPASGVEASITLTKVTTTATIDTVGQQVPYQFLVVNTGGLTLSNVNVTDVQTPPSSNADLGPISCPATTLAPGASTTCIATYTVTQADLDNGGVTDTATAHGTPPGSQTPIDSAPSSLTVPAGTLINGIAVVKSSPTTAIDTVGQQVPYQFLVTNTGGRTLTDVSVTDVQTPPSSNANLSPINCPVTTLAPGVSTTCTATYTVTQADLDNDGVSDTATAHGTPSGSQTPIDSAPSSLTIPAVDVIASISLAKLSTTTTISAVGQQVPYQFLVANTGGRTLTDVTVTDVQTPPSSNANLGPISCPVTTLAPGAATTCTATYTVTQADLDNGSLTDTARAHGTPAGGGAPVDSGPSTLTIPAVDLVAAISVDKSSPTATYTTPGQQIQYRYLVVNTGGLTLSEVNVTDVQTPPSSNADLGPISCPVTTLAPGAATTCTATYTVTQADLDNGTLTDTATSHGTPPRGGPVDSPPATLTITAGDPTISIAVIKSSTTVAITAAGQQVPFSYLVVNNGGRTLTGVTVNDTPLPPADVANLGPITCGPDDTPNGQVTLAPGAAVECHATYTVAAADLGQASLIDVATVTGTPPSGPPVVSPSSQLDIPVLRPAISLTKSVSPTVVAHPGDTLTYRYVVTNTGNTTLSAVTVNETQFSGTGTPSAITCGNPPVPNGSVSLDPGASTTCTATYSVTRQDIEAGRITNTAIGVGTPPQQQPVSSGPSSTIVTVTRSAAITLTKSGTLIGKPWPDGHWPDGHWPDGHWPDGHWPDGHWPDGHGRDHTWPGDSATGSGWSGSDGHGGDGGSDDHGSGNHWPDGHESGKPGYGQQIRYRFVVTNTGTVILTGVTVNDTLAPPADPANLGPITCGPDRVPNGSVTLTPGASITCEAIYTVSKADYQNGTVTDTATATGTPPEGPAPISPESTVTIRLKGKLPVTGDSLILPLVASGALALLLGASLVLLTRRRRTEN